MRSVSQLLLGTSAVVLIMLIPAVQASASPGDLDPSFGVGGIVKHVVTGTSRQLNDMAIQPDGKIVVVGTSNVGGNQTAIVTRYLPNGALDTGFASNGIFQSALTAGSSAVAEAVAIQPDGKIVVAGSYYSSGASTEQFLVGRLIPSGQPDGSFISGGFQTRQADGTPGGATSVVIQQPSGRIIAAGHSTTGALRDFAMIAINGNGSTASFGPASGFASQTVMSVTNSDQISSLTQTADGKLVAVGTDVSAQNVLIARYSPNGILDGTFGTGGKVIMLPGTHAEGSTQQSDGKIVVTGQTGAVASLLRFSAGGTLDPSFGSGGISQIAMPGGGYATAVAQQASGKLVAVGGINTSGERDMGVLRVNANGSPDASFGAGGIVRTSINSGDDEGEAVTIQPDGKIVAADWAILSGSFSNGDFGLARYDGSDPVVAPLVAVSKIKSPSKSKLKRKKFKKVSGTAGPAGSIKRVEIAIRQVYKGELKQKKCVWLKSNKAKFKSKSFAKKKMCLKPVWLKAKGTGSWTYKLKKSLPAGKYEISSRTTLTDGTTQTKFTKKSGNFRKLELTK